MSKNDKRSPKKHKPSPHEAEFNPLLLSGLPKDNKQFNAKGFKKSK